MNLNVSSSLERISKAGKDFVSTYYTNFDKDRDVILFKHLILRVFIHIIKIFLKLFIMVNHFKEYKISLDYLRKYQVQQRILHV